MSARKGLTYLFGSNAVTFAIQFGGSVAIARLLSPPEMGVYAASMALVWIINGVLNAGLQGYLVRERDMPADKLGTVLALTFAQSALFAVALFVGGWVVGWFAHDDRVTHSIRILAWYGAMVPIYTTLIGLMQRQLHFHRIAVVSIVNTGVSALCTIGLAAAGFSWRSMPIGTGIGVTVGLLWSMAYQRRDLIATKLSRAYMKPILDYGVRIAGATFIMNITNRAPDILLTRAQGAGATGLYNRGANLVDTFNNNIMSSVIHVMSTQMAHDRDTPTGIGPIYAKVSAYVTGVFWPAFALMIVLAKPIVALLFGARWMAAAPVLAIVALAGAINMIVANRSGVLVTVGRERDLPRLELIRGALGVAIFTIAAYSGGLLWAAFTRVIDGVIAVVLYSPGIHAATRLKYSTLGRGFARSAALAGVTAVPALAAMWLAHWPDRLPFVELAGVGVACALAWLGGVFALRHDLASEIARAAAVARGRPPRLA